MKPDTGAAASLSSQGDKLIAVAGGVDGNVDHGRPLMGEGRRHRRSQVFVSVNVPGLATECLCGPGEIRWRVSDPFAGALLALLFYVD